MKKCYKCKLNKPIIDFWKSTHHKDKLNSYCKLCDSKRRREHFQNNKQKTIKKHKKYFKLHKTKITKWQKQYRITHKIEIAKQRKQFRQEHKEELAITSKQYYQANKDNLSKKKQQYYQGHKAESIEYEYFKNYGLTTKQVIIMFNQQVGRCLICDKDMNWKKVNGSRAVVDHDHKTGQVRGLICSHCNVGIGHFKDDINQLLKAVAYLQNSLLTKVVKPGKVIDTNTV